MWLSRLKSLSGCQHRNRPLNCSLLVKRSKVSSREVSVFFSFLISTGASKSKMPTTIIKLVSRSMLSQHLSITSIAFDGLGLSAMSSNGVINGSSNENTAQGRANLLLAVASLNVRGIERQ